MADLRKYGVEAKILFPLVTKDAADFITGGTLASGDATISKDEGTFTSTTNTIVDEGNGFYSLTLTATEMQAARIAVAIVDQTAPKEWEDTAVTIDTYGNASAEHAFDLDTAATTPLDAAGIRSAVGLSSANLDTQLSTIDGVVDDILVDTNDLQTNQGNWLTATGFSTFDPATDTVANVTTVAICTTNTDMRGTDNALLASGYTAPDNASITAILTDTGTTIPDQITALNNLSAADVNAEVDTALADYDAPTKAEMDSAFTEIKGAAFSGTTDSLEAIRDRGDAAWVTGSGSGLDAAGVRAAIGLSSANLDTQLGTIDTVVDAIKVKTDSLTFTVSGQVDANTESMNGSEILGDGTSSNLWRGA